MRKTLGTWLAPGAILAALALAGCGGGGGGGGGSSSGGGTTTTGGGGTTTGGGGTIYTSSDGNASVTYPTGTTPTVTPTLTAATPTQVPANTPSGTAYTGIAYDVVDSAGFSSPVTLTITYPAGDVASGMVPAIYEDVNGTWTAVSGSAAGSAADTVTVSISQPGIYGVLAPTNLTAPVVTAIAGDLSTVNAANDGNFLSWTASTDAGGGAITYNIYRSTSGALTVNSASLIASGLTGTTFHDSQSSSDNGMGGAQDGTPYYYAVSAQASSAPTLSVISNETGATPGGPTASGIGDPVNVFAPNAMFTSGTFTLDGSSSSALTDINLSITLTHAPQASDLKSIQIEGTVIPITSTQGITVSGDTIAFDSISAGITLPTEYNPLHVSQYYSITANVATTAGGSTTAPLELTGLDSSATALSQTTIGNYTFNINP